jgi:hypothetical protein
MRSEMGRRKEDLARPRAGASGVALEDCRHRPALGAAIDA